MASLDKAVRGRLQALYRRIDVAHRAARCALFTQHVPGFEHLTQFQRHAAVLHAFEEREADWRWASDHAGSKA